MGTKIPCPSYSLLNVELDTLVNKDVIIGGSVGDACGSFYENKPIGTPYIEYDNWILTDDTELTLSTIRSIIRVGAFDIHDMANEYLSAYQNKKLVGIGASTLKALRDLEAGMPPYLSGRKGEFAAGNGAAMRVAPLCAIYDPCNDDDRKKIREFCFMTHVNDEAYCGALALMGAILGDAPVQSAIDTTFDSKARDVLISLIDMDEPIATVAQKIGNSGFTPESVPLAIYAASIISQIGFKQVIIEICRCGGDADTIASIAGQIMASNGFLPDDDWLEKLPKRDEIMQLGMQLEVIHNRCKYS